MAVVIWLPATAYATVPDGFRLEYRVLRDGFEIGRHKVLFRHGIGGVMTVETEIRITVTLLFITLYDYSLDSTESWRGDRLIALESTTDDDGDLYAVSVVAEGGGLTITAGGNHWIAPAAAMPTSLWRRAMARGSLLFGVEQGESIAVTFTEIGRETVTARGGDVEATKVVASGELERELWYDDDGMLARLRLIARDGSTITYDLMTYDLM